MLIASGQATRGWAHTRVSEPSVDGTLTLESTYDPDAPSRWPFDELALVT
jgi:hypothetical protein